LIRELGQADGRAIGNGDAAIAADRCGCEMTTVDCAEALREHGRHRAEGLSVKSVAEAVEDLTYSHASFDAVLSCVMIRVLA
jgi:ubiquinone/menaquinone biosynthesis C-methylase UbiE